ncbi:MAG: carboxypeptidase-like regulatory domain-containing protein [Sphingobacteriaceae bacterium]|nr:carboxypeptidase-like regulatory domain-containing protein [Sphingobacteriaceae bacterium]
MKILETTTCIFIVLFFLSISNLSFAQYSITGKVLNASNNLPLESATVFVNTTSYGTKTDRYGNFVLRNVKAGYYELIFSMVGFKTYNVQVYVQHADKMTSTVSLEEKVIPLIEVNITKARRPGSKYMEMFKREILGTSKFAEQCRIINPEVIKLSFDKEENKLTAYSTDFMIIENKALGYHLKYLVEDFERNEKNELISYVGYVLFEAMEGSEKQQQEWSEKRIEAYTGSLQHFLRSLLGNNINKYKETGFLVMTDTRMENRYRLPDSIISKKISLFRGKSGKIEQDSLFFWTRMLQQPKYIEVLDTTKLKAKQVVHLTDSKGLYSLRIITDTNYVNRWAYLKAPGIKRTDLRCDTCQFKNSLYVTYIKYMPEKSKKTYQSLYRPASSITPTPEMDKMASLISILDGNVFFDWNGVIVNPMSLKLERYWAKPRLGDLLPIDYAPM